MSYLAMSHSSLFPWAKASVRCFWHSVFLYCGSQLWPFSSLTQGEIFLSWTSVHIGYFAKEEAGIGQAYSNVFKWRFEPYLNMVSVLWNASVGTDVQCAMEERYYLVYKREQKCVISYLVLYFKREMSNRGYVEWRRSIGMHKDMVLVTSKLFLIMNLRY